MTQDTLRSIADETDGAPSSTATTWPGPRADRPRLELLLPARLQLHAGADRRQVPPDHRRSSGAASTCAHARGIGRSRPRRSRAPKRDAGRAEASPAGARLDRHVGAGREICADMGRHGAGEAGKTRVTLIWEPLPQPAGVRRDQPQPGRVSLIAADPKGISYSAGGPRTPRSRRQRRRPPVPPHPRRAAATHVRRAAW